MLFKILSEAYIALDVIKMARYILYFRNILYNIQCYTMLLRIPEH